MNRPKAVQKLTASHIGDATSAAGFTTTRVFFGLDVLFHGFTFYD
jgi:hypothetical protein